MKLMADKPKRASVLADRIAKRLSGDGGDKPKINLATLAEDLAERKAKMQAGEAE